MAISTKTLQIGITISALIAILLRLIFPTLFERIDFVSVALLVVAAIPWVSPLISKISIPGVIEAELRELKREFEETKEEAASASEIALRSQNIALLSTTEVKDGRSSRGSSAKLVSLAKEYTAVRASMPGNPLRTSRMDELFGKMVKEARNLGPQWKEYAKLLRSDDGGDQLSGIAYAYAFPAEVEVNVLIDTVENSQQRFVQYWGLRAIQRALDADGLFSVKDAERLHSLPSAFSSGTDRFIIASGISRNLRNKQR
ncbi:hypothetical protein NKI36_25385 [Mesorhizobium caraganae]|uniref:Uncharacterized protein n=1 Tax=Mesorhizobium caraganae TaxID=483206 RepID=A0ABV1Z644_9HYPH